MGSPIVFFDLESGGVETGPSIMSRAQWDSLERYGRGPKSAFDVAVDSIGHGETGRLSPAKYCPGSPIIQIAAAAVDESFEVLETFEVKLHFRPELANPESLEMNSWDADVWVAEAVPVWHGLDAFCRFVSKYKSIDVLKKDGSGTWRATRIAGHNVSGFDLPMIMRSCSDPRWQRHALPGDAPRTEPVKSIFFPGSFGDVLDTYALAKWWNLGLAERERPVCCSADADHSWGLAIPVGSCPECEAPLKPSLSLPVLARYFGFGIEGGAHDALADVLANVEVGRRLLEELGTWAP